jgi:hypothetical protein
VVLPTPPFWLAIAIVRPKALFLSRRRAGRIARRLAAS